MEKFMPTYGRGYTEEFFRNTVRPAAEARTADSSREADRPLAIAFVRDQDWEDIYTGECALARGTIFAGLYFPLGTLNRGGGQFE